MNMRQMMILYLGFRPLWGAPGPPIPGERSFMGANDTYPMPWCVPSIWTGTVGTDHWHIPVCLHHDWLGVPSCDETTAVAHAHDHSHPGWRDVPVMERKPAWDTMRAEGSTAKMNAYIRRQMMHAGYTAEWIDDPWAPIVTRRSKYGTRCVPRYNHASLGYDLSHTALDVEEAALV